MTRIFLTPLQRIDGFLNGITMYRTVLYALLAMAGFAVAFGFAGWISYGGFQLLLSLVLVSAVCYVTNTVLAKLLRIPANAESWFISALILFFLFSPILEPADAAPLALSGVVAMASKYLFAWRGKHLFNPAAFAAVALGLTGFGIPVWWIGTVSMLPVTLVLGLLIVRKIRRFTLFLSCVAASFLVVVLLGFQSDMGVLESVVQHLTSWPILFFASVMVTEPLTMPPRRNQQIVYGAFVGALSSWPITIGPVYFTPELVLLIGNLYAYTVSLRRRLTLRLKERRAIANDTYEFAFDAGALPRFSPGQYLEWTLPHARPDARGNRRFFTIASSPTERELLLGVKIGPKRSSYKEKLLSMQPGETLYAGQLGGDFTLPKDPAEKLVFMAGGIGITPFRSMLKHLVDMGQKRDIVLFYGARTPADFAYRDILDEAGQSVGLRTVFAVADAAGGVPPGYLASIDDAAVRERVPDFRERTFYLSGPVAMVDAYKAMLTRIGVHRTRIVTDYFPGFA